MERKREYNYKEEEFLKDSRGRKVTEGEGKEEGEEGEARKNSVYKKAIGIVFWNVAIVKSKDRDF